MPSRKIVDLPVKSVPALTDKVLLVSDQLAEIGSLPASTASVTAALGGADAAQRATLTAAVRVTASGAGAVERAVASKLLDFAYPEDYGAVGDGTVDDIAAIEACQTAAREIRFNAKTYKISRAIRNVSNRRFVGKGTGSTVLHNPQNAATTVNWAAFTLGNTHPGMFKYSSPAGNQLPSYDTAAVLAGDHLVTMSVNGQESNFTVGQWVVVRHRTEIVINTIRYPLYAQLVKIRAIDTSAHTIEFHDVILEDIASACLNPLGTVTDTLMGVPWDVVENVAIEHMTVSARGIIGSRNGNYSCRVADIECVDNEYLLAVNFFCRSTAERLKGRTKGGRLLEVKCYSQGSIFRDIEGRVEGTDAHLNVVEIGEQANRITLDRVRAHIPPSSTSVVSTLTVNGFKNSILTSEFVHKGAGVGSSAFVIPSNDFAGYGPHSNRIVGSRFVSNSNRTHHGVIGAAGAAEHPQRTIIEACECIGATSSSRSIKVAAGGTGGMIIACELPYALEISSGAVAPGESVNNYVSQGAPMVRSGTSSAEGVISALPGDLYMRRDITTGLSVLQVKTNNSVAGVSSGWLYLMPNSGASVRGDVSVTLNGQSANVQIYSGATLTADRYITAPSVGASNGGWWFQVWKLTNAGSGKAGFKNPAGTILAEIPAASTGVIHAIWDGTNWYAVPLLAP